MRSADEMFQDIEQVVNDEVYNLEPHEIEWFLQRMDELSDELWAWHRREGSL